MKFNFSAPFYLLLAVPLFFASCSKEGPAGAQGPAGPAGPTGAAGAAGAQGAQGDPGTANVIYSAWLDVSYAPVTDSVTSDTILWNAEIPAPQLSDSILNGGDIKVFMNWGSTTNPDVVPLPLNDPLYFFPATVVINTDYFLNTIMLSSNFNLGTATATTGENVRQCRYILIPGGTAAGRNPKGSINWNNYEEVKKYLGLKD